MTKYTRRRKMNQSHHSPHYYTPHYYTPHHTPHGQAGGIPIFAGAQGCVFKPSLKCKHKPHHPNDGNVSKLEYKESAESEMREYEQIKSHLKQIPNYQNYFSVQAELCEPAPLTARDLAKFDDICTNMKRYDINAANVNASLSQLRMINMPDLGIDLQDWLERSTFDAARLHRLNEYISKILVRAVVPMNERGVIHNDLKAENLMIDRNNRVRIIDWGLAGTTTPEQVIPVRHFMNNPVTFNRPFSTMVISNDVRELYASKVLAPITNWETEFTMARVKEFTAALYKRYIDEFDIKGYEYFEYIFKCIYGNKLRAKSMLHDAVSTYTAEILYHFTDRTNRTFRMTEYFEKVYRYNTDVWGAMCVFYSMFMLPRTSFIMSDAEYDDMLRRYRSLFSTIVFANGHERMNVSRIVQELRRINAGFKVKKKNRTVRFNLKATKKANAKANALIAGRVPTPYPMYPMH
jgi:serine/threonine protein kinase